MFTLTFTEPGGKPQSHPLADEKRGLLVGRDPTCDVALQSKEVSRRHARFFVREGALWVEDLGSQNGVFVGGARIEEPAALAGGPAIEIGDVKVAVAGTAAAKASGAARAGAKAAAARAAAPGASGAAARGASSTATGAASGAATPEGSTPAGTGAATPAALPASAKAAAARAASASNRATRPAERRSDAPLPHGDSPSEDGVGAGAVLRGKGGREIRLPAKATVGRGAECDVVLDDDSVSRRHAELARDERGLYRVRDLDSANGTFLDGTRLGKDAVRVREGATLRFGDVELLLWRPPSAAPRRKLLLAALVALIGLVAALILLRRPAQVAREAPPEEEATALVEQAQAAIEGDRYDEAARLAQQAIDLDPLAQPPRRVLAQARREQQSAKVFAEASAKGQVGREDEALVLLSQIPPQSRFFPRARIKARELGAAVLRTHGRNCRAGRESALETADACARALDVKCQEGGLEADPMLQVLRAAEKRLPRRVAWSCPRGLSPLFTDVATAAGAAAPADQALPSLYPDPDVLKAMDTYARGDVAAALVALTRLRGKSAAQARELIERLKVVQGRFREGQTALLSNAVDRTSQLWGEALAADAAVMPAGAESFLGHQMRSTLARVRGESGDDRFGKGQYESAYDQWAQGLAVAPRDPHLLDSMARLEKIAEDLVQAGGCSKAQVAAHITRADPPSPAHEAAQKALEGCR